MDRIMSEYVITAKIRMKDTKIESFSSPIFLLTYDCYFCALQFYWEGFWAKLYHVIYLFYTWD